MFIPKSTLFLFILCGRQILSDEITFSSMAGSISCRKHAKVPPKIKSLFTVAEVPTKKLGTPPLLKISFATEIKFSFPHVTFPQ